METQTDNSNLEAKATLRNYFLAKLPRPANILECFAGEKRELYHACYEKENVTALDMKNTGKSLKIDNRKFIGGEDIDKYNFFDLDAYGSPYELFLNILYKRRGVDPFAIIFTDGLARNLGYGSGSKLIQTVIKNQSNIRIPFLNHHQEFIIKLIIKTFTEKYHVACLDCKIVREGGNNNMRYFGALFQRRNTTKTEFKG